MLLTRRALTLLLITAVILAGTTFVPALGLVAALFGLGVAGLIIADYRLALKPDDFSPTRTHDARLSLGADNPVTITVDVRQPHTNARQTRWMAVRDEYPPEFAATNIAHDPSSAWVFRYTVRPPRRGDFRFGDVNLRWLGRFGLIIRQASFSRGGDVKVYPNLLDIRRYELLAKRGQLAELGFRRVRLLGSGTEFERLREYTLDDEFRHIDWNAMARRGKPITREYETERSQNIVVLLDAGRLMRSPVSAPTDMGQPLEKIDYAINATLMLAYVAGLRGDKVGILVFADDVRQYLAPKAGKGQFYRLLALLYSLQPQPVESSYARAVAYLKGKHTKRSLIVLFGDLAPGLGERAILSQVGLLSRQHVPLFVAVNDPAMIALAQTPLTGSTDVYRRAMAEQVLNARALTLQSLSHRGVDTLDVPADKLTVEVVNRYLEIKARGRL